MQQEPMQPAVIVIDDDELFRRSVMRLLKAHGYRPKAYESFEQFMALEMVPQEGCVVLDLNLPRSSGLEIQKQLASLAPALCIVFLTGFGQVASSVIAMKNGAVDFLEKPVDAAVLLQAIDRGLKQSGELSRNRTDHENLRRQFAKLSARERDVFALITSGRLNKQAGAELGITERTVKYFRKRIMDKMGAESLAELVRMAHKLAE